MTEQTTAGEVTRGDLAIIVVEENQEPRLITVYGDTKDDDLGTTLKRWALAREYGKKGFLVGFMDENDDPRWWIRDVSKSTNSYGLVHLTREYGDAIAAHDAVRVKAALIKYRSHGYKKIPADTPHVLIYAYNPLSLAHAVLAAIAGGEVSS